MQLYFFSLVSLQQAEKILYLSAQKHRNRQLTRKMSLCRVNTRAHTRGTHIDMHAWFSSSASITSLTDSCAREAPLATSIAALVSHIKDLAARQTVTKDAHWREEQACRHAATNVCDTAKQ